MYILYDATARGRSRKKRGDRRLKPVRAERGQISMTYQYRYAYLIRNWQTAGKRQKTEAVTGQDETARHSESPRSKGKSAA